MVATEIERLRLARDRSNRVEALTTAEFGRLISALNETARLSRQAALGRPAREQFVALLASVEPLAKDVPNWYQLQILVGNIAKSADRPDRAVIYFQNAHDTMQAQLDRAGLLAQTELRQQVAFLRAKLDELMPRTSQLMAEADQKALAQIEADARRATDAYNKLFNLALRPLPVKLLPVYDSNAYTDGKTFSAPAPIAQLPEITWHNMSWPFIDKYLPVFDGSNSGSEAQTVAYSYSDILPALIRQLGLVESSNPHSWDLYAGGLAWIKAALRKQDFKLGDDLRPLRSMANPGKAYSGDPDLGGDTQISQYRDLTPTTETHSGAGIGTKAFYETAQRLGSERAGKIWLDALVCLSKNGPATYKALAICLLQTAGADRMQVQDALRAVGLDGPSISAQQSPPIGNQ
jgi:hypothetical protein